jgi:hypothetical protein
MTGPDTRTVTNQVSGHAAPMGTNTGCRRRATAWRPRRRTRSPIPGPKNLDIWPPVSTAIGRTAGPKPQPPWPERHSSPHPAVHA